jgi:hypothetical protein
MLKNVIKIFCLALVLCAGFAFSARAGKLSEYSIVCGSTPACSMSTSACWECKFSHRSWKTLWTVKKTWTEYICSKGTPSGLDYMDSCSNTAGRGGESGDSRSEFLGFTYDQEQGYNCVTQNYKNMYKICYPCTIVGTLISSFTQTAGNTYDVMRSLANVILVIGTVLWLAMYVLKNISAFTTAEPMRMLQDIFVQLFKVFIATVIVNAGLDVIVAYTLVPILNTGTDFGAAVLDTVGGTHD